MLVGLIEHFSLKKEKASGKRKEYAFGEFRFSLKPKINFLFRQRFPNLLLQQVGRRFSKRKPRVILLKKKRLGVTRRPVVQIYPPLSLFLSLRKKEKALGKRKKLHLLRVLANQQNAQKIKKKAYEFSV